MAAGIVAIMIDLLISMGKSVKADRKPILTWMMPAVFVASFVFHINVMHILSGLRAASVGLIASAAITILWLTVWNDMQGKSVLHSFQIYPAIIILVAFFVIRKIKPNPILVILCGGWRARLYKNYPIQFRETVASKETGYFPSKQAVQ